MNEAKRATSPPILTIGAVSRATGFSPDTLRVWNRRYGFPAPQRKPSGHRLYSAADVRRLRRISVALSRGHRPGQVVPLSEQRLEALLSGLEELRGEASGSASVSALLERVRKHDGAGLTAALLADAASLGPLEFLRLRAIPLIQGVGDGWERGELGVHHEHFFSQRLEDILRTLRLPFERGGGGPRVVFATLSGETHGLGLQMAALTVAAAGGSPHLLGTDTPVDDITAAVKARRTAAVGISISVSTAGAASRTMLQQLRRAVPSGVAILVGGGGARRSQPLPGCLVMEDLAALHDWMGRPRPSRG